MAQEIANSTLLDTWASSGLKVEPDISKIIEGWQLGEQPPHEYMNWLQNTFGSKLNHILKNGVASWNNETQYLAGSSVQHNGNVWLCKTTNTNSEPTDENSNWKRIITVESLTTVLNGYVKNSGNETIAGIKTFSSSPIVPTPATGDNSTKVATTAFVKAKSELDSIGVGQTYQHVSESRNTNQDYTNTSGKPILLIVTIVCSGSSSLTITVGGVLMTFTGSTAPNDHISASVIVPNGAVYRFAATESNIVNKTVWELR